jgi:hypothetical protein
MAPDAPPRDRPSTAAFVLGLIAAITGVVYFVSVPFAIAGLIVGVIAIRRPGSVRRLALGGIVLSMIGLVVGLGLVAFLLLDDDEPKGETTIVDGIVSETGDDTHPPQRDLDPAIDCRYEKGALRAEGSLVNRTDAAADYQIIVMWERDGRTVAQSTSILEAVPAGATQAWEIIAVGDETPGEPTCHVSRIDRTPTDD